jgi:anti-sigma B factor antagonist
MALFPSDTLRIRRTSETSRVVEAYGELDIATAPRLEETLVTIGNPPVREVDLDLSAVSLVDAYAMRCIQRAARKLAARGCSLRITAVQPRVRAVLALVGFDRVVPVEDDADPLASPGGAALPA